MISDWGEIIKITIPNSYPYKCTKNYSEKAERAYKGEKEGLNWGNIKIAANLGNCLAQYDLFKKFKEQALFEENAIKKETTSFSSIYVLINFCFQKKR